ncbi:peptidyl-tRNA hydrolase domain-containing protein [Histoplasma capsulatum G186AR]|uniref:Peptidyl-tRNA hydrolase domain-containing protein n=1 Tax=Ajellomyces capsulatus (strain G186AR / H82 / ATCC MYA-2454 / RMSCC 2432) TaxID=447093 RepID=C0NGM8_AJECG|nr:peptidyl-tRNA hydrolase domain-containing protein [Histoplasma capsulatum G186AR]EEH08963.1 peptidyl-tRNA hydrolase domain-containing protein [Histoplasma capsulatum G186AR]
MLVIRGLQAEEGQGYGERKIPIRGLDEFREKVTTLETVESDRWLDGDVSYSRSSGPGGQNVNKVNSKVTLKIPLSTILRLVPRALHAQIRSSRYIAERSDSLVIQSDETRKQTKNLDLCFEKLRELLLTAGKMAIPGETSPEQRKKVQALEKANNESRIRSKKARSMKKSSRRSSGYDD